MNGRASQINKRGLFSDFAGLLGIGLALIPWLYFDSPGWGSYLMTCIGAMLAGTSRADSLSDMLGRGNAGDEFIKDSWQRFKIWWKNRRRK